MSIVSGRLEDTKYIFKSLKAKDNSQKNRTERQTWPNLLSEAVY